VRWALVAGLLALTALPHPSLAGTPSRTDVAYVDSCLVAVVNGEELDHPGSHLVSLEPGEAQALAYQLMQHYGDRAEACESAASGVVELVSGLEGK